MKKSLSDKISFLQKVGFAIFVLILSLAILEGILRASGWLLIKCRALQYEKLSKAYALNKGTPNFKILCLGDSSSFGSGLKIEYSYPFQLWELLNKKEPVRFKVVSIGLPGASSSQLTDRYEAYLKTDNFNLVIFQAGSNDAYNLRECNLPLPGRNKFIVFLNNMKLFYFLKICFLKSKLSSAMDWTPERENNKLIKDCFLEKQSWKKVISYNFSRLKNLSSAHNISFWPQNYHTPGWMGSDTVLQEAFNELALVPIDQASVFTYAKGISLRAGDRWHPNAYGYFIIARLVYNKMIEQGILKAEKFNLYSEIDALKVYIKNRGKGYEYLIDNQSRFNEKKFIEALGNAGINLPSKN